MRRSGRVPAAGRDHVGCLARGSRSDPGDDAPRYRRRRRGCVHPRPRPGLDRDPSSAPAARRDRPHRPRDRPGAVHRRIDYSGPRDEVGTLAEELDRSYELLEAAITDQARFLADVSHELRTPLAASRAHVQLLQGWAARMPSPVRRHWRRCTARFAHDPVGGRPAPRRTWRGRPRVRAYARHAGRPPHRSAS